MTPMERAWHYAPFLNLVATLKGSGNRPSTTDKDTAMLTEYIVYDCATCAEPKHRHQRTHDWIHLRGDSLCDDASAPVEVRRLFPVSVPA